MNSQTREGAQVQVSPATPAFPSHGANADTSKHVFAPAKQYHTTQFSLLRCHLSSSGSEQRPKGASVGCKQLEKELQPNTQLQWQGLLMFHRYLHSTWVT